MSFVRVTARLSAFPLLLPPLARLSDVEQAKKHYKAGAAYFEQGEFEAALSEFQSAHQLSRKPELQYNIAVCLEKLQRYSEAVRAFQKYLQEKPEATDRVTVESRINLLQDFLKQTRRRKKITPPSLVETERPLGPTPSLPETEKPGSLNPVWPEDPYVQPEASKKPASRPYRTAQWTALGLSVTALGVGLFARFKAKNKAAELSEPPGKGPYDKAELQKIAEIDGLADEVDKWQTAATVGFIGGAALLGTAGLFYWLDQNQISVAPTLQTKGAGVLLRKDF